MGMNLSWSDRYMLASCCHWWGATPLFYTLPFCIIHSISNYII